MLSARTAEREMEEGIGGCWRMLPVQGLCEEEQGARGRERFCKQWAARH